MKNNFFAAIAVLFLFVSSQFCCASGTNDATTELQDLVSKIQTNLKAGKKTEKELADNLKEFDTLLTKHKGKKTDDVAQILLMKAMLYLQVFDDTEKGVALINQLKKDFPETKQAKGADAFLDSIKQQEESKKISRALVVGSKFPEFDEKDVDGKPLSIANYKGKVVLVDFWATWCGPCVAELPNVIKTYQAHHGKGFEVVGISLDQDKTKLTNFTKQKSMSWSQYFDGQGWGNKLAVKYGIHSIPATFLLDGEGKIIAKDLRGETLEKAVADALAKK